MIRNRLTLYHDIAIRVVQIIEKDIHPSKNRCLISAREQGLAENCLVHTNPFSLPTNTF